LWRITQSNVGTALGLDDEVHRCRRFAGYRVRNADVKPLSVYLLDAEEFVFVVQTFGKHDFAKYDRAGSAGVRHLVAIQVVTLFDHPVDLDCVAGISHGVAIRLLRSKYVLVLRRRGGRCRQQAQQQAGKD
jgi:hypothetical protein